MSETLATRITSRSQHIARSLNIFATITLFAYIGGTMRLTNTEQLDEFLSKVRSCTGDVWLESAYGDRINLKSRLSQFIAIGALLTVEGDNLELYCSNKEDEVKFLEFFGKFPETV